MHEVGIEPTRLSSVIFETTLYTYFSTHAYNLITRHPIAVIGIQWTITQISCHLFWLVVGLLWLVTSQPIMGTTHSGWYWSLYWDSNPNLVYLLRYPSLLYLLSYTMLISVMCTMGQVMFVTHDFVNTALLLPTWNFPIVHGDSCRTWTYDPQLNRLLLLPTELTNHNSAVLTQSTSWWTAYGFEPTSLQASHQCQCFPPAVCV